MALRYLAFWPRLTIASSAMLRSGTCCFVLCSLRLPNPIGVFMARYLHGIFKSGCREPHAKRHDSGFSSGYETASADAGHHCAHNIELLGTGTERLQFIRTFHITQKRSNIYTFSKSEYMYIVIGFTPVVRMQSNRSHAPARQNSLFHQSSSLNRKSTGTARMMMPATAKI